MATKFLIAGRLLALAGTCRRAFQSSSVRYDISASIPRPPRNVSSRHLYPISFYGVLHHSALGPKYAVVPRIDDEKLSFDEIFSAAATKFDFQRSFEKLSETKPDQLRLKLI